MDDRTAYFNWMLCFLAGGIAGAGVALLLAPQSGRSTREMMGRKLRASVEEAPPVLTGKRSAADEEDLASVVDANGGQG
jgi:gas vesicle protein